jgi:outer membrane receptor protein involved in Fe transport
VDLNEPISIDIAAGTPLFDAVIQWSRLAGVQVSLPHKYRQPTNGLHDRLPAAQALDALLEKFGLTYELSDGLVVVKLCDATVSTADTDQASVTTKGSTASPDVGRLECREAAVDSVQSTPVLITAPKKTGSHIPGVSDTTRVTEFDRDAIDRSGYRSTGDFIRSLPQSFGGGFNFSAIGAGGSENMRPASGACTVNVRGLGSESTLTLLDGNRLPFADGSGAVDLCLVPLAAVDHFEVITDGASAVYGSDAVAGVVNVITRKNYRGAAVSGSWGGTTRGGGRFGQYEGIVGTVWDGGDVFAALEFSRQSAVDARQRSFVSAALDGTSLLPETRKISAFASLEHELYPWLQASAEAIGSTRYNIQNENLGSQVAGLAARDEAKVEMYGVIFSMTAKLSDSWYAAITAETASDRSVAPESLRMGGLKVDSGSELFVNRLHSFDISGDGVFWPLPAGPAKAALGIGHRSESFGFAGFSNRTFPISGMRDVNFEFIETSLPLLSGGTANSNQTLLTLNAAERFEHFSDFGSSVSYKVRLIFLPLRGLQLRSSFSTSFRSPTLLQETDSPQATLERVADPATPGREVIILQRFGGNPQLHREQAATATFDVSWTPVAWPDLFMQLGFFYLDYKDRIQLPISNTGNPLATPGSVPFIVPNPSETLLTSILAGSQFSNKTGAPYDPGTVADEVDNRYNNVSREKATGFDLTSRYNRKTGFGNFNLCLDVTRLDLRERVTSMTPFVPLTGKVFYPSRYRSRSSVTWATEDFNASMFLNYVGPLRDADSIPPTRVSSYTTWDSRVGYTSQAHGSWRGLSVALFAQNVLDTHPPHVDASQSQLAGLNYDSTNASALGRLISLQITTSW